MDNRFWFVTLSHKEGIYGENTPHYTLFSTYGEIVDNLYKVYYGAAPQWTTFDDGMEIVHSYGIVEDNDYDRQDDIYANYDDTFGKPTPIDFAKLKVGDISGWLAPDGAFYSSGYMGHSQVAADLVRILNIPVNETDMFVVRNSEALRRAGWASVWAGAISSENAPTSSQIATLNKIALLCNNNPLHAEAIALYMRLHRVTHIVNNKEDINMHLVQYVSNRTRCAEEFGEDYDLVLSDTDLDSLTESYPKVCKDESPTGAFVKVGEGEYTQVWLTWSNAPYLNTATYSFVGGTCGQINHC